MPGRDGVRQGLGFRVDCLGGGYARQGRSKTGFGV